MGGRGAGKGRGRWPFVLRLGATGTGDGKTGFPRESGGGGGGILRVKRKKKLANVWKGEAGSLGLEEGLKRKQSRGEGREKRWGSSSTADPLGSGGGHLIAGGAFVSAGKPTDPHL